MALKLRRAKKEFIPHSTRAASFKRLLGGGGTRAAAGPSDHNGSTDYGGAPTPWRPVRIVPGLSGTDRVAYDHASLFGEPPDGDQVGVSGKCMSEFRIREEVLDHMMP